MNRQVFEQLVGDLVIEAENYDQNTYGRPHNICGAVCCMGGLIFARHIAKGFKQFKGMINKTGSVYDMFKIHHFVEVEACRLLDIDMGATIFGSTDRWPIDLRTEYILAVTPRQRVIVALKALQRTNEYGSISFRPTEIFQEIPQLAKLQAEEEAWLACISGLSLPDAVLEDEDEEDDEDDDEEPEETKKEEEAELVEV